MLVAQLRWPVPATKWWTMQELAQLLLSSTYREVVEQRLQEELAASKLESEAIEVLTVFWMATAQGYIPKRGLVDIVTVPSIGSDLLLQDMFEEASVERSPETLAVAPIDFVISNDFLEAQGTLVARMHFTKLQRLEMISRLPFVRQCAFEWSQNRSCYPEAPVQGDLRHFYPVPLEGMTGAFASRATLRMLSAYLRTIAVAGRFWKLPAQQARLLALEALPVDPTLAFLRAKRPEWVGPLHQITGSSVAEIEAFIHQTNQEISSAQPGTMLLALVSPTHVSEVEICELEVVRWAQWELIDVDAALLADRYRKACWSEKFGCCRGEGMTKETKVPMVSRVTALDSTANATPTAVVYGFDRIGYLQRDLYPARLFYPVSTTEGNAVSVRPRDGHLQLQVSTREVGSVHYWNAGWAAVHPYEVGAFCGTGLIGHVHELPIMLGQVPSRYFYLWKLTRLTRPGGHGQFASEVSNGVYFV